MISAAETARQDALSFFDKEDGSMSAQRATAMLWALRSAGLDVGMTNITPIIGKPQKSQILAKKVRTLSQQYVDAMRADQKKG